jgi:hypothetical protein
LASVTRQRSPHDPESEVNVTDCPAFAAKV